MAWGPSLGRSLGRMPRPDTINPRFDPIAAAGQFAKLQALSPEQRAGLPEFAAAVQRFQELEARRQGEEIGRQIRELANAQRAFDVANRNVLLDKLRRSQIVRPEQMPPEIARQRRRDERRGLTGMGGYMG